MQDRTEVKLLILPYRFILFNSAQAIKSPPALQKMVMKILCVAIGGRWKPSK